MSYKEAHLWMHQNLLCFLCSSVGVTEIFSKMLQCCLLNGGIFWVGTYFSLCINPYLIPPPLPNKVTKAIQLNLLQADILGRQKACP